MNAKSYQADTLILLKNRIDLDSVEKEWPKRQRKRDIITEPNSYMPRLDIAIGPFNLTSENSISDKIRIESRRNDNLVLAIISKVKEQSNGAFGENINPRCLISIELEWETSSKHILGGLVNASSMGYVGVLVAPNETYRKIERITQYVRELSHVNKTPMPLFSNVACFEADEFKRLISDRTHL